MSSIATTRIQAPIVCSAAIVHVVPGSGKIMSINGEAAAWRYKQVNIECLFKRLLVQRMVAPEVFAGLETSQSRRSESARLINHLHPRADM
jgi:hypothetical protein